MIETEKSRLDMAAILEGFPFLKQILGSIKQVVWVQDAKTGQVLYASPAFETVWGRSREGLYADPFLLLQSVHAEDRVNVMSSRPEENRKFLTHTYRILQPDGSLHWISADSFLIVDESSGASYHVCVAQDITGQSQLDETLRKALDRSREQFTLSHRMSLARKPAAVLKTLMSAAELRSAKRAFALFFESPRHGPSLGLEVIAAWSPAEAPVNAPDFLNEASLFEDLVSPDLFQPSKALVVTGIAQDQRLSPLARDVLKKAAIETFAVFPMVALGSGLGCLVVFFGQEKHFEPIDLRQLKVLVDQATITLYNLQLLEVEAESRHEAERANEIKTKFLAMISHELRTPLTSIKGFTTTLLAEDVIWEPEEQRDFIQTIHQETNRLQELIDHLLDLSRLEAGMLPITLEPHSLQDIIEDALPQLRVMTQKHAFLSQLPPNLPPVLVDAKRIAQVLVNLVHNATLYTPPGTEIILSASQRGDFVEVSVMDQGPGIPPAERKYVFQAFRRGLHQEDGAGKGAGLGLAICKGLVEAHGGQIWMKKRAAPGTTISFTIPLAPSKRR